MKKLLKKGWVCLLILVSALCFSCCANTSLKDITKPYLGEYECKSATLGEMDMLNAFSYIKLELQADDRFLLTYKTKHGETGRQQGAYKYDGEEKSLILSMEGGAYKRSFPIDKGTIDISLPIGGKQLYLQFSRK